VALPESLPLSMTLSLAHAAKQLKKSNIFVKHLNDAETMGGVDCLCITKTGFLTKNMLSITQIYVEDRITNVISSEIMS
jgi:Ca2+-transporting ATPase